MLLQPGLGLSTAKTSLDTASIDITEDSDIRSPRTPTYQPTSPTSASLAPFDPAKLFFNLNVPLIPKATAPPNQKPSPPPSDALAWVWQCHLCKSRWPLGVTRRCLIDGHFYCSGDTAQPNLKRKRKGQSCSSEFDYVGWKDWGAWKRNALKTILNPRTLKGCERCEFPSQCRYGAEEKPLVHSKLGSEPMAGVEYTCTVAEEDVARYYSNDTATSESNLAEVEATGKSVQSKMTDLYKAEKLLKRSTGGGEPEDQVTVPVERRKVKTPSLSPIEEETPKEEAGLGLSGLVMPLVEFLSYTRETRKSLP